MLLQFKIRIKGISKPPVWRRVLVPDSFSFHKFHLVIQNAFDWEDCHLYSFEYPRRDVCPSIGIPSEEDWEPVEDSRRIKLGDVFKTVGESYVYVYDFGDYWVHDIKLEEIIESKMKKAQCIDGKGACPPEDCGGVRGYEEMKRVFAEEPEGEEADSYRDWMGMEDDEGWDPNEFYLEDANTFVGMI